MEWAERSAPLVSCSYSLHSHLQILNKLMGLTGLLVATEMVQNSPTPLYLIAVQNQASLNVCLFYHQKCVVVELAVTAGARANPKTKHYARIGSRSAVFDGESCILF